LISGARREQPPDRMSNKRLLDRPHAQLLLIDLQERLMPAIHESERVVRECAILLQAAARLDLPQTVTLQNPEKLGDIVEEAAQHFRSPAVFGKMAFSAWGEKLVEGHLKHSPRRQLILCGAEAHICVLQTALDLVEQGFQVFVPHGAVGSRDPGNRDWALHRMRDNGVVVTSTESALFELLGEAGTDEFRELRKLIV
jgi:nicotinamidase-related amidase